MDKMDIAFEELSARQTQRQEDAKHEELLHSDEDYALDQCGMPQVMQMLENVSVQLSKYGHELCVPQLIYKLKEM